MYERNTGYLQINLTDEALEMAIICESTREEALREYWEARGYEFVALWFDKMCRAWVLDLKDAEGGYCRNVVVCEEDLFSGKALPILIDESLFVEYNYQLHLLCSSLKSIWRIELTTCKEDLVVISLEYGKEEKEETVKAASLPLLLTVLLENFS